MLVKIALLIGCITVTSSAFGQGVKNLRLPILNGSATVLPKPEYTQELQDLCAYGKVEIQVAISAEGRVEDAKPVSGDPILYESALKAVRRAKFRFNGDLSAIKHMGLVVYDFPVKRKCIEAGVVNKRARNIPQPDVTKLEHLSPAPITVEVRIVVDMPTGEVKAARAFSGNILYFAITEKSALGTKFTPANINGRPVDVKATLVYKFNPNGSIEY
jgi:TonB family protein